MYLKVEMCRLFNIFRPQLDFINKLTIITFIKTLERNNNMKILNKLLVRWISISGRGEVEVFLHDYLHIVTLMNFELFPESRQMETAARLTHSYSWLLVRAL
jgi:hypothetical protein